jgi:hypothetical protein
MLSMILQLDGLVSLIVGITVALSASVDAENKEGKFDFWYQ